MTIGSREWRERENDPNAVGSRAWYWKEREAADQMIALAGIIAILILVCACLIVIFALSARGDGTVSEEHYRIGIDPAPPARYHRLYLPVYTEGNETEIHFVVELDTAGSGSPRFDVEFLDDANLVLKQMGTTYYEKFTTGSSAGVTTTFDTRFKVNVTQGWPVGTYWFVVNKETEANDWCLVDFTLEYWTDLVGNGGLVERRFDGVEASVAAVTRDVELVEARAAALEAALADVRNDIDVEVLNLEYLIERANFSQREEYLSALAVIDRRAIDTSAELNKSLNARIDALAELVDLKLYISAIAARLRMDELNASVQDLRDTLNGSLARTRALEDRVAFLEVALLGAARALNDTRADVAALDNETAAAPETARGDLFAAGILGGCIGGGVTATLTSSIKRKKEG
jgi:hypothetical protein